MSDKDREQDESAEDTGVKPTITIAEKEDGKDEKPTITIAEKQGSGQKG